MLQAIRAVSLDLDDTLWDTPPVIRRAESVLREWLERHYPRIPAGYDPERFRALRLEVLAAHPARAHDLAFLRTEALRRACVAAGYPEAAAGEAFEVFQAARNDLAPFADVPAALARLAASVEVWALSNGTACVRRVGLGAHFRGAVDAAAAGAPKPDPRIFAHLLAVAGRAPHEVLHVGDDPVNDVEGARAAGFATAWMNRAGAAWPVSLPRPHYEVRDLAELAELVAAR